METRESKVKSLADFVRKNNLTFKKATPIESSNAQRKFFEAYDKGSHLLVMGYPGTGKTFLALSKAFEDMLADKSIKRVIICRSPVSSQDIGFLPGTEEEKASPFEEPYIDICAEIFGRSDAYELLKKNNLIKFRLTAHIRGLSMNDSVIVMDEFQNLTAQVADTVIGRVGCNSRFILCGDLLQTDLCRPSERNVHKFLEVIKNMPDYFELVEFNSPSDIVRSGVLREYIIKKYEIYRDGFA